MALEHFWDHRGGLTRLCFALPGLVLKRFFQPVPIMKIRRTQLILVLLAGFLSSASRSQALAQDSDATSEVKQLKTTNERLLLENEALREELDALKKKLAEAKPATRPEMLSAAGAANGPKKIVYIIDASGSMMD